MFRTISEQVQCILIMESETIPFNVGDIVYFDGRPDERYVICSIYIRTVEMPYSDRNKKRHTGQKLYDMDTARLSIYNTGSTPYTPIDDKSAEELTFVKKAKDQSLVFETRKLAEDYVRRVRQSMAITSSNNYIDKHAIESGALVVTFSSRRPEWSND